MKITIIHHVSNVGGGTIGLVDICRMLSNKNDVTVIMPERNSKELSDMIKPYAKIKKFTGIMPQISYYSGSNNIISFGFIKGFFVKKEDRCEIVHLIKESDPDIVIANSIVQCKMGQYIKNLDAKKIIYIRETFRENIISKFMIKIIEKYFDAVLCISPYEKKYAEFSIPCKVVTDCYQISGNKYENPYLNNDKYKVLFMGGDSNIKGLEILLKSIDFIKNRDVEFHIIGNVNLDTSKIHNRCIHLKEVKRIELIRDLSNKYKDNIFYHGFVNETQSYVFNSDVVIFPSIYAHQARPAIEAGYASKPVIISGFKQTECFFENNENCLTFEPKNSVDLAKKIDELSTNAEKTHCLGRNNFVRINKEHNFQIEEQKLNKFVNQIMLNREE